MNSRTFWKMPKWMKPYREMFCNTGGNSIEELMNDQDSNMFNNAPRAALAIGIDGQVGLLTRLYKNRLLAPPGKAGA